jgi:DNA-binding transcriptional MerR regulator
MRTHTIEAFTIAQAARLSGLTRAMVDYLCRQRLLLPSATAARGRGRPRKYSFGDVVMLRILANLLKYGVAVHRLRKALQALRHHHRDISPVSLPAAYLVTNGHTVHFRDRAGLLDLDGSGQMSFLFVVELAQVRDEVAREAAGA